MAGLNWRAWSIRETTGVLYRQLVTDLWEAGEKDVLRELLKACGDKAALAQLDRESMGQGHKVEVDSPPVRGRGNG